MDSICCVSLRVANLAEHLLKLGAGDVEADVGYIKRVGIERRGEAELSRVLLLVNAATIKPALLAFSAALL